MGNKNNDALRAARAALMAPGAAQPGKPKRIARPRLVDPDLGAEGSKEEIRHKTLKTFTLDAINVAKRERTGGIGQWDVEENAKKAAMGACLMFLALQEGGTRVTVVSRLGWAEELAKNLGALAGPSYSVEAVTDARYRVVAAEAKRGEKAERGGGLLIMIATDPASMGAVTRYYEPEGGLYGLRVPASGLHFHTGEAWLPPFSARHEVWLRAAEDDLRAPPRAWQGEGLQKAVAEARAVASARAYIDPEAGAHVYLLTGTLARPGGFPNDYSHLFYYAALRRILERTGTRATGETLAILMAAALAT
jgi:hypothetical protein